MNTEALARKLLAGAMTDGGASVHVANGTAPRDGYMVGISGLGFSRRLATTTINAVVRWLDTVPTHAYAADNVHFGSWVDTDGRLYLDLSQQIATLDGALDIAALSGEIAVWDVANGREVRV